MFPLVRTAFGCWRWTHLHCLLISLYTFENDMQRNLLRYDNSVGWKHAFVLISSSSEEAQRHKHALIHEPCILWLGLSFVRQDLSLRGLATLWRSRSWFKQARRRTHLLFASMLWYVANLEIWGKHQTLCLWCDGLFIICLTSCKEQELLQRSNRISLSLLIFTSGRLWLCPCVFVS